MHLSTSLSVYTLLTVQLFVFNTLEKLLVFYEENWYFTVI